jgi:hypothetical protein
MFSNTWRNVLFVYGFVMFLIAALFLSSVRFIFVIWLVITYCVHSIRRQASDSLCLSKFPPENVFTVPDLLLVSIVFLRL